MCPAKQKKGTREIIFEKNITSIKELRTPALPMVELFLWITQVQRNMDHSLSGRGIALMITITFDTYTKRKEKNRLFFFFSLYILHGTEYNRKCQFNDAYFLGYANYIF